jgi:hypothetical protein
VNIQIKWNVTIKQVFFNFQHYMTSTLGKILSTTVVGSHSPPLEVKVTPGQKTIHHSTPTSNIHNKKLLK